MRKEYKALRDQIRVAVPNPVMRRSVLLKVGKALRASIKEYEDTEEWLKKRKDLLAIHPYGKDGFALDFGHGTSSETVFPTIHAAVAAAIREKK